MTDSDGLGFVHAFNRLAVATRLPAAEADEAMQRIYWEGLEDLPLQAVADAAAGLEKSAQWFPKVAEWREAAKPLAAAARVKLLAGSVREEPWHHECELCEDQGWQIKHCFPEVSAPCGVRKCRKTREHTYAVVCGCRETNRTYQRNREFQRARV